ncbi:hypothetical protein [Coleofasciculus sp. FACHB-1120]|uniref:hypothetical protein n=1 Tax=Coleofasciculus sp. FACHB-1120 TaxID=2692783 RepID=UPI0016820884|nr:hypothetical protein [Coleofasciculus sp. FACHB-1120]MBD2743303.1 hypothetical protein [Coleofasciculus sp. FACHB-1120]
MSKVSIQPNIPNIRMAQSLSEIASHQPYPKWQLGCCRVRSNLIKRSPSADVGKNEAAA